VLARRFSLSLHTLRVIFHGMAMNDKSMANFQLPEMEYSVQLNNLGVQCLDAGCDQHFIMSLFNESLHENLLNMTGGPSALTSSEQKNRIDQTMIEIRQAEFRPRNRQQRRISWCGSFVYTKAILLGMPERTDVIPDDMELSEDDVSITTAVTSAIILYNLGLINHLIGFSLGEANQVYTRKARKLYEMAFSLVSDALDIDAKTVGSPIVIATLNNLGQINQEIGRFDLSKECFEKLSKILLAMALTAENVVNNQNALVSESDWAGLLFNAMIFQNEMGAPAA
jgi:tetratricopeptide (TPR) repeat protein